MEKIRIYTDGACSGNPGPGGWGAILVCGSHTREIHGGKKPTTNNRMELRAVIEALRLVPADAPVEITTDSTYVKDGMTKWLANWKAKGWRGSDKKPVKNQDLWAELDSLAARRDIEWRWVRGHAGHPENERADELARMGVEEMKLVVSAEAEI
ncbi:MAG: ribonuclease HI [Rickettsiales bacterium]|jgi:ribonuclease HI|nr:ribonuclease HI [Rickettsiales bacterium]